MSCGTYSENSYENAVIESLLSQGWMCLYGPDVDRDYRDPTYARVLERAIYKHNPDVPAEAIEAAIRKIKEIEGGTLVARNAVFTEYLQCGVEASCAVNGEERTFLVKLVDFETPENNLFQVINQWTVAGKCVRRPDMVLFVNGLPLVVIELKNPSKPETTCHDAYLQLRNYQQDIPELFVYNQICVVSDMVSTKAGSLTAYESWFKEWKSIDGAKEDKSVGNFETLLMGLLEPARLLDVLKNFICFSGEGHDAE